MKDGRTTNRDERGIALVVAMLVLVFLALIASALMISMNVETKIAGTSSREAKALNFAEAGVSEALERIRSGDVPNNLNPKMVTQIFLAQAGSIPAVGADTTALPTQQDPTNWLSYSTAGKTASVLTVTYKTDPSRTKIYRYDSTKNPTVQTNTGNPIFVVTSTGRSGDATRTVVSEVMQTPISTYLKGAVVAKKNVHIKDDTYYCGYDHSTDTPLWTNMNHGRDKSSTSCNYNLAQQKWELGTNDVVGVWSGKKVHDVKKGGYYGTTGYLQDQSGFYSGPWDVFGMSQSAFYQFVGAPISKKKKVSGTLDGIYYYDPDGKAGKSGGDVEFKNVDGEGFLFVDGDMKTKGSFTYTGLIYATGKIQSDGKFWVLGAVVSGKDIHLHNKDGDAAVLYSKETIEYGIGRYAGPFVTLSWREAP